MDLLRITSAALAHLFLMLSMGFAANPEDLYTREGTDPTPAETTPHWHRRS
jgi:hypothetical protein